MKRRDFLQAAGFLTVSAATLGLNACVGGSDSPTDGKFPQGVASADPQPDAIVLWTRAVPASADDIATPTDAGNLAVKLQVTASDNSAHIGSTVALTGTAVANVDLSAQAGYDYTLRHKLTGLMAGTTYYYQFSAGAARSAIGRFKTAPAKSDTPAQLKFAALVCQDWSVNHWATFSDLVASEPDLDFFLHLGDYIYESVGKAFQTGEVETAHSLLVLPNGTVDGSGVYATTVADYRYLYKRYRSDARLQAVHARYAMIAIWDDHEFSDDCWGDAETYDNGTYNASTGLGDNTHQTARRRYANQAWFEFMPADIRYDDSVAGYQTIKLYRDLQFGTLAHVVMTDQRLYRSDHLIPEAAPNPVTGAPLGNIGSRALVPETVLYDQVEAAKIAAGTAAGDRLALVSMLGATQRAWLKTTLQNSPATWKLWGSEVMLTRMGLDGSNAIATLIALSSISTLATSIGTTATSTGSVTVAAALVAAMTAGATQATASAAAVAISTADASAGNLNTAATGAGLSATQAGIAVAAYSAAKAAAAAGSTAQATAAAQTIAFGYILPDIQANKSASSFVPAAQKTALAPYFTSFVLDADAWDGYDAERRDIMAHLRDQAIANVVAVTGDIHAFFAGEIRDDYRATGGGTAVMTELVVAGASSSSYYSYLKDAVGSLSASLATLVFYPITGIAVPGVGSIDINLNLLDYTLARSAPTLAQLGAQARRPVRAALAAKGVAEAQLDAVTDAVVAGLEADSNFSTNLLGLAQALASLGGNPWIKHVDSDAQGYAVLTVTAAAVRCELRKVHRLVANIAPAAPIIDTRTVATVASGVPTVTIG